MSTDQVLRACIRHCVLEGDPAVPRKILEGLANRVRLADRLYAEELIH